MFLEELFKKETGLNSRVSNRINNNGQYNQHYVDWLEKKITLSCVGCSTLDSKENNSDESTNVDDKLFGFFGNY
jgi:uncharacterized NAD(P)/FAD-binding protein YdhS